MLDIEEAMQMIKSSPRKTKTGSIFHRTMGIENEFQEYE